MNAALSFLFSLMLHSFNSIWKMSIRHKWLRFALALHPVSGHGIGDYRVDGKTLRGETLDLQNGAWVWARYKGGELRLERYDALTKQWMSITDIVISYKIHMLNFWKWVGKSFPETSWIDRPWWWLTKKAFTDADWEAWQAYYDDELIVVFVDIPAYLGVPQYPRGQVIRPVVKLLPYRYDDCRDVWGVGFTLHGDPRFGWKVLKTFNTEEEAKKYLFPRRFLASGKE